MLPKALPRVPAAALCLALSVLGAFASAPPFYDFEEPGNPGPRRATKLAAAKHLPTPGELARRKLFAPAPFRTAPYGSLDERMVTPSGRLNIIVVPVQFGDTNLSATSNDFVNLYNGSAYSTVSNYYAVQSYGKLALVATVMAPVSLPSPRAVYNWSNDYYNTNFLAQVGANLTAQFAGWSSSLISSTFDANGDGFVDAILFVHAGEGGESTGSTNDIWSHQYSFYLHGTGGDPYSLGTAAVSFKVGPLFFGRYLIVAEILNRGAASVLARTTIGTTVHEFGHILGLTDLYNTRDSTGSDGKFLYDGELMSGGSYNSAPTNIPNEFYSYFSSTTNRRIAGKYPAPISAYHKRLLGWLDVSTYTLNRTPMSTVSLTSFSSNSSSLVGKTALARGESSTEYWLVENRYYDPAGAFTFDQGLNGRGLLIWRVQEDVIGPADSHYFCQNGMNNNVKRRGLRLEPMSAASYSNTYYGTSYAFWSNSLGGFSVFTSPNSTYEGTGERSGVTLSNISSVGETMTFGFRSIDFDAMAGSVFTAFPAPFSARSGAMNLVVTLADGGLQALWIVTDDGRLVKDVSAEALAGARSVGGKTQYLGTWNGLDRSGQYANPGVLFVRARTAAGISTVGRFYVRP